MTDDPKTIDVSDCPLCSNSHSYPLAVSRVEYIAFMTAIGREAEDKKRHFTILAVCPKTGKEFQIRVSLAETPMSKIKGVQVGNALAEDVGNDNE